LGQCRGARRVVLELFEQLTAPDPEPETEPPRPGGDLIRTLSPE
jgi:hypothetical protein